MNTKNRNHTTGKPKNPTDFLKQVIGKSVIVKLNSGVTYRGVLACLDVNKLILDIHIYLGIYEYSYGTDRGVLRWTT